MRKIMFLTVLMCLVVFAMPAYADSPKDVNVVNEPKVHVETMPPVNFDGNVNVTNTAGNPVPVVMDGASSNGAVIKGIRKAEEWASPILLGTRYELVSLEGPGTFVGARVRVYANDAAAPEVVRVILVVDGNTIVYDTFFEIGQSGPPSMTPFGVFRGTPDSVHIGFQQPVSFDSNVTLYAELDISPPSGEVHEIRGTVIYGE